MYQKQIIVGRLTRDPESTTYGENTVCRFSVAVDDGFGEKKQTDFFNCSAWGKQGENVQKFTQKGAVVLVEGKMKSSKKEDKYYWELRADQVRFLSSNNDGGQGNGGQQQGQQQQYQHQQQFQPQGQQQFQQPNPYQQQMYQQQQQPNPYAQPQFQQQGQNQFAGMEMNISDDSLPF
ncbi:single-stranded DNA-binding protein [Priestia megaterium]